MAAEHACQLTFFIDDYIKNKINSRNLGHLHGVLVFDANQKSDSSANVN
jgi:hypothetical protein